MAGGHRSGGSRRSDRRRDHGGATILSPNYQQVTGKSFTARAHGLGLKVIPWTVNDTDAMRIQIGYDVDGIITDYPTRLRGVLASLGMALPRAFLVRECRLGVDERGRGPLATRLRAAATGRQGRAVRSPW